MGGETKKPYILLGDKPLLACVLDVFEKSAYTDEIFVVVSAEDIERCVAEVIAPYNFRKIADVLAGGATRQESVFNGLQRINEDTDLVVVHDGVRPFVTEDIIEICCKAAWKCGAAIAAVPVKDTIKVADEENFVKITPKRDTLWAIQTPQVFQRELLLKAHLYARDKKIEATDDAALIEQLDCQVKVVMGSYRNIKITTQEDLIVAKALQKRVVDFPNMRL